MRSGRDALAIDPDDLPLRVDPSAEPAHDLAVDFDPPGPDEILAAPPAPYPSGSQHLLQPQTARHVDERVALAVIGIAGVRSVRLPDRLRAGSGSPRRAALPHLATLAHCRAPVRLRRLADQPGTARVPPADPGLPGPAAQESTR